MDVTDISGGCVLIGGFHMAQCVYTPQCCRWEPAPPALLYFTGSGHLPSASGAVDMSGVHIGYTCNRLAWSSP